MSSFNWTTFESDFLANGIGVIEGVAGVGKTYGITRVNNCLGTSSFGDQARKRLRLIENPSKDALDDSIKLKKHDSAQAAACKYQAFLTSSNFDWFKALFAARGKPRVTVVVMHPSQAYENLVGGLRPVPSKPLGFEWSPGVVLDAFTAAIADIDKGKKHLLVFDEINRCNLAAVFGELFVILDATKRVTLKRWQTAYNIFRSQKFDDVACRAAVAEQMLDEGSAVKLPASAGKLPGSVDKQSKPEVVFWPDNLFILGTMNSSDRSIVAFDQAMRRRFPPTRMDPHPWLPVYEHLEPDANPSDKVHCLLNVVAWAAVNAVLRSAAGPDAMLGHSYWYALNRDGNKVDQHGVRRCWEWGILPQVVHSAESCGCEAVVSRLFGSGLEEDDISSIELLEGSLVETGLADMPIFKNAENAKDKIELLNKLVKKTGWREHRVSLVGDGQGRRVLIVNDTTPSSIATVVKELQRISGIGASTPANLENDIKQLFGIP